MKLFYLTFSLVFSILISGFSQSAETSVKGRVVDENQDPISFASIVLFSAADSMMSKAGYSEDNGTFELTHLTPGQYYINISFVGYDTYSSDAFDIQANTPTSLDIIKMSPFATELGEVVVAATKPVIEVKPDKTVFNIEGSVNSMGNNALELLRKAPGVVVDNNERLMLIGKTGVKVYIDGKPSILRGDDFSNYLKSLQSSQIEAIEIITQPSARYEAEGNAGIINIRLIKDRSLGTNANINMDYSQSTHSRYNTNVSINNRTQKLNVFANANYANGDYGNFTSFTRIIPELYASQENYGVNGWNNISLRGGADYTTGKNSTIGVLFDGYMNDEIWTSQVHTLISPDIQSPANEILEGSSKTNSDRDSYNFNGNYRFDDKKGNVLNVDLDFGTYKSNADTYQPNYYYDAASGDLTDTRIFSSLAPTTIDIKTVKLDYEKPLLGGNLGAGFKLALINTDNNYNFFDIVDGNPILNTDSSNRFTYDENVNAGYATYNRQWKKVGLILGLRVEQTDSKGELTSFKPQNDQTVEQKYVDVFPSGGITYQLNQKNMLRVNYSRRIDRPNYQDLNPFEFKLDEITFQKGNPFLKPQYSNSFSLGHTYNYTLNTTLTYSHTNDLMAQLTDTASMGAAFITTANVAEQDLYSINVSYPFAVSKIWNVFFNTGVTNMHNQADFGDGKVVDISATTFNIYAQNSFILPMKFTFELSGWYNSPGIWGGNFATDEIWSIDAGIQKKVFHERGNIKVGISDIFHSQKWAGRNNFGGLKMTANGGGESRQFKVNFSYLLGNSSVKGIRNRNTGLEDETKRIKSGN